MFRTLIIGALALALASCSICYSPSNCGLRSSGGMSNSDAAALSRYMGGIK